MTYQIKAIIPTKLTAQQVSDGLQALWDANSIAGHFDVKIVESQAEFVVRRTLSDDIDLIHARIGQTLTDATAIQAAGEQFAAEMTQYDPPGSIREEAVALGRALEIGEFEIIQGSQEIANAMFAVRDEINRLFDRFIEESQALIVSASKEGCADGFTSLRFDQLKKAFDAWAEYMNHDGLNKNAIYNDAHPSFIAENLFRSFLSGEDKLDSYVFNDKSIEDFSVAVQNYADPQNEADNTPSMRG